MQLYLGKNNNAPRKVNQDTRVVLDMTKKIEKSERNVTGDHFFCQPSIRTKVFGENSHHRWNTKKEQTRNSVSIHHGKKQESQIDIV